jgi:hypothetical protein
MQHAVRVQWEVAQLLIFVKILVNGFFYFFSHNIQHCFICRPSDTTVRWMLGSNPGPLQLVHWQSDALTTRKDLIHF